MAFGITLGTTTNTGTSLKSNVNVWNVVIGGYLQEASILIIIILKKPSVKTVLFLTQ